MNRAILVVLLIALLGAGGYFAVNYQVETQYENGKASGFKITPRTGRADVSGLDISQAEPAPRRFGRLSALPRSTWAGWTRTNWAACALATCWCDCCRISNSSHWKEYGEKIKACSSGWSNRSTPPPGGNTTSPPVRPSAATASNTTAHSCSIAPRWRSITRRCISSRIRWGDSATNRW